jgi:hypothetical protein
MVIATPDLSWNNNRYFLGYHSQAMETGEIFESILERSLYKPDGTIKRHFRDFLVDRGKSELEIAQFEAQKKLEIEERKLFVSENHGVFSWREPAIARSGLELEELLSQGYIAIEDLL